MDPVPNSAPDFDHDPAYSALWTQLMAAYYQSAEGKGKERHADGKYWVEQPIFTVARRHGVGFLTGQAEKKLGEAAAMIRRSEDDRAYQELLGAIVYAAAAAHAISTGDDECPK